MNWIKKKLENMTHALLVKYAAMHRCNNAFMQTCIYAIMHVYANEPEIKKHEKI